MTTTGQNRNRRDEATVTTDRTPRYVPDALMTAQGVPGSYPVVKVEAYPAGQHPSSPIVKSMTAVRCTLANGAERWFGCESAHIDASLRMVVIGTNPRDESPHGMGYRIVTTAPKGWVSPFADLPVIDGTPAHPACLNDRRRDDARRDAWYANEARTNPATKGS